MGVHEELNWVSIQRSNCLIRIPYYTYSQRTLLGIPTTTKECVHKHVITTFKITPLTEWKIIPICLFLVSAVFLLYEVNQISKRLSQQQQEQHPINAQTCKCMLSNNRFPL